MFSAYYLLLTSIDGTKSLALLVLDPDAPDPNHPKVTWSHWIVYNLPPSSTGLEEAVTATSLPGQAQQGFNDWKEPGYGGPQPPIGKHRYFFKLFALDTVLTQFSSPDQANKDTVQAAMMGHILDQTELMGTFEKSK